MSKLPFAQFQNLLDSVGDIRLYDSVKPQVQTYAENVLSHLSREDAFRKLFELANDASTGHAVCVVSDTVAAIERMGKGKDGRGTKYETKRVHVEKFYYFFIFDCDDPTYGDRISKKLFRKSFHEKFETRMRAHGIARPAHLPPLEVVPLGDIAVSFGFHVGLRPLTLQEPEDAELGSEGELGVLRALDWRSRLTSLHGRDEDRDSLVEWALDASVSHVKVSLVSGPGGSGKSRLVADAVRRLVHNHGWVGGFLPAVINSGDVFDGAGNGVALIIDYPEQRPTIVRRILTAAFNNPKCSRPLRIILVSREGLQVWTDHLNAKYLGDVTEIKLQDAPYLSTEDAIKITEEVASDYPFRIGKAKAHFRDAERWLSLHPSHRLPLITLAASVHAVLEPDRGFTLSEQDVLLALARLERTRVRSYSSRDLGDREALERLLALSLLSPVGLSKETIHSLGYQNICEGRLGEALVRAVRKTPFWKERTEHYSGHLLRLEPDRPAAAFLWLALELDDPDLLLSNWLIPVARQDTQAFVHILARLCSDLTHVSTSGSSELESIAVRSLEVDETMVQVFAKDLASLPSVFSMHFCLAVCDKMLLYKCDAKERVEYLNFKANALLSLGDFSKSEAVAHQSLQELERFPEEEYYLICHSWMNTLKILINVTYRVKKFDESIHYAQIGVDTFTKLARNGLEEFSSDLGMCYGALSNALHAVGRESEALDATRIAEEILGEAAKHGDERRVYEWSIALSNLSLRLRGINDLLGAKRASLKAVTNLRSLAVTNPELHEQHLGIALDSLATAYYCNGEHNEALVACKEAIELLERIAKARPEAFLSGLASSLNTLAVVESALGKHNNAASASLRRVEIYRHLIGGGGEEYQFDLAQSLVAASGHMRSDGRVSEALTLAMDAVEISADIQEYVGYARYDVFARALRHLAMCRLQLGNITDAISSLEAETQVRAEIASDGKYSSIESLASTLEFLSQQYVRCERYQDALEAKTAEVDLHRKLAKVESTLFLPLLANSSLCLAQLCVALENPCAEQNCDETVLIWRELVRSNRGEYFLGFCCAVLLRSCTDDRPFEKDEVSDVINETLSFLEAGLEKRTLANIGDLLPKLQDGAHAISQLNCLKDLLLEFQKTHNAGSALDLRLLSTGLIFYLVACSVAKVDPDVDQVNLLSNVSGVDIYRMDTST